MSGIDFTNIKDDPLVEKKSYSDSLDDKFNKNSRKISTPEKKSVVQDDNTVVRKTTHQMKGWSLTEDQKLEFVQEYKNQELVRSVSYLHPRIKMEQLYANGEIGETRYLLDDNFPLSFETETVKGPKGQRMENLYLYDGDKMIFKRHNYLNKTYREDFSVDDSFLLIKEERQHNEKDKIDSRYFNSKGTLAAKGGKKSSLKYKPYQITFYSPQELNNVISEVAEEFGHESKSALLNKLICGVLDEDSKKALEQRTKQNNVTHIIEGS